MLFFRAVLSELMFAKPAWQSLLKQKTGFLSKPIGIGFSPRAVLLNDTADESTRMKRNMHGFFRGLLACVFLLLNALQTPAFAQEVAKQPGFFDGFNPDQMAGDHIHAMFSPYSYHYSGDAGHQYVWLVGAERERQDGTLAGLAFFSNSFGQHTFYYYPWGGIVKNVVGIDNLFVKWTAGMLYGYVAPYEDKVPFNYK